MLVKRGVNIKTKTITKYSIDQYIKLKGISQNELGRLCGIEPRNMTARKTAGSFIAVSGGKPYLMPKKFKGMFE